MTGIELLPEFAGFFDNACRGRLAFPRCNACDRFHWYPMPRCPHCRSSDVEWRQVSGRGEIFSYTSVQHAFDGSRRGKLPYLVALITFDDAPGVRLITNIVQADADGLRIGQPVEPVFPVLDAKQPLVHFRVTKAHPGGHA